MIGRIIFLAMAGLVGMGHALAAGIPPELEYGYPEQAPRVYTDAQGRPAGFYPRLLDEMMRRAGLRWHATSFPAPRLMHNLQSGETSLSILVKNPLLETCCLYSTRPVWNDKLRAYWTGAKPAIAGKEDLNGKTVIVLAGFSYGGLIDYLKEPAHNVSLQTAESHKAAFDMLRAGRADYLLDYEEAAQFQVLDKAPLTDMHSGIVDNVQMYLVLNKTYPDAATLMTRLEGIYAKLWDEDSQGRLTKR